MGREQSSPFRIRITFGHLQFAAHLPTCVMRRRLVVRAIASLSAELRHNCCSLACVDQVRDLA